MLSRRTLISGLAASGPAGFRSMAHADARLAALGGQFGCVSSHIDLAIEGRQELTDLILQQMDERTHPR